MINKSWHLLLQTKQYALIFCTYWTYTVKKIHQLAQTKHPWADGKRWTFRQIESLVLRIPLWLKEFLMKSTSFFYRKTQSFLQCMLPRGSRVCLLQYGDHPGELPEEGAGARVHPHDAGWGGRHPQWVHHPATGIQRVENTLSPFLDAIAKIQYNHRGR